MHATLVRFIGVDAPWIHRTLPVFEIAIADHDRDRRSERFAAANAGDDLRFIVLDLHPSAAAVAVLSAREITIDAVAIERHAGRHAADDDRELRSVRFAGGEKTETAHAIQPRRRTAPKQR